MRWSTVVVLVAVVALSLPIGAIASTNVPPGSLPGPQVWTPAGSPYILTGDIIVPVGVQLTVQAGVTVLVNPGDAFFGGFDSFRTEIRVLGALAVQGTPEEPVVIEAATGPSRNTWTGIRVELVNSVATIDHAVVRHAGIGLYSAALGQQLTLNRSRFEECGQGLTILNGAPVMERIVVTSCDSVAQTASTAQPEMRNWLMHENGFGVQSLGPLVLANCTIDSCGIGVYASGVPTVVRNCSITNNANYGVFRDGGGSLSLLHNNVWNSGDADYFGAAPDGGSISADPMYEDSTDFRLLACSPNIEAGSDFLGVPFDAFGTARPFDADNSGEGQWDIGWHELADLSLGAAIDSPPVHTVASPGSSAVLSVVASGTEPLSYQWRRDGVALADIGTVSGATTDTLTIDPADPSDLGVYDCVVSNACGSATTNPVALCVAGGAPCEGNANGDGVVDFNDIVAVLSNWLSVCP